MKEFLQPAGRSETIYETGRKSAEYSPAQQIDESLQPLADFTNDENSPFATYLEQCSELPRNYIEEGIQDTEQHFLFYWRSYLEL